MRISERGSLGWSVAALILGLILCTPAAPVRAAEIEFATPEAAFDQGISAYRNGRYRMAIEALEFAARSEHFRAQYYLARIYSNNSLDLTNHGRAYAIFKKLVDGAPFVDRYSDPRASYIAKSYVQLALYNRTGLETPDVKLPANSREAVRLLEIAANLYDDRDAQFELAKVYLSNDGVSEDLARGKDRLIRLAKSRHAGAQAFLADLLWRGRYFEVDHESALFWISSAMLLATENDRFWIEEIYQVVYCGSSPERRERSHDAVMAWQQKLPQQAELAAPLAPTVQSFAATTSLWPSAMRTCPDKSEIRRLPARR
jgi:hypothetical protein